MNARALAALAAVAALSCGGGAFTSAADAGSDAGDALRELEASADDASPAQEASQPAAFDSSADASIPSEAADVADHDQEHDAAAADVAIEHLDAGGAADAPHDAPPALCCHVTCGGGTLPPDSGWTCQAGTCAIGGYCTPIPSSPACGVVEACP